MSAVTNTVRTYESATLRYVRHTIEAEMIAAATACVRGTQAHVGQLELLAAIGAELDARNELLTPPPYVDVCKETVGDVTIRSTIQVRVY